MVRKAGTVCKVGFVHNWKTIMMERRGNEDFDDGSDDGNFEFFY